MSLLLAILRTPEYVGVWMMMLKILMTAVVSRIFFFNISFFMRRGWLCFCCHIMMDNGRNEQNQNWSGLV